MSPTGIFFTFFSRFGTRFAKKPFSCQHQTIFCTCSQMVLIRRSEVSQYLQDSVFYSNLDLDDDEPFEVPDECMMQIENLTCLADLQLYLKTFQFWGLNGLVEPACIYMYRKCGSDVLESLEKEFHQIDWIFALIKVLQEAYPEDLISTALMCNVSVACITWFHNKFTGAFARLTALRPRPRTICPRWSTCTKKAAPGTRKQSSAP